MEKIMKTINGQWTLMKAKDSSGDDDNNEMLMSQLKEIVHHVKEITANIDASGNEPDWVNAKITEAAKSLSDVAHFIDGLKKEESMAGLPKPSEPSKSGEGVNAQVKKEESMPGLPKPSKSSKSGKGINAKVK
jgi:Asp-tRNA(Asn)/Glu-tRNA(Gln) amidotransferase C subunit